MFLRTHHFFESSVHLQYLRMNSVLYCTSQPSLFFSLGWLLRWVNHFWGRDVWREIRTRDRLRRAVNLATPHPTFWGLHFNAVVQSSNFEAFLKSCWIRFRFETRAEYETLIKTLSVHLKSSKMCCAGHHEPARAQWRHRGRQHAQCGQRWRPDVEQGNLLRWYYPMSITKTLNIAR
jgi:hypothetical protein